MKKTLTFKIFGGYLFVILLIVLSLLTFSYQTIKNHYMNSLTTELENIAVSLRLKIKPLLISSEYSKLDSMVKSTGKNISTRITVINPEGMVIADSEEEPETMENHSTRPEIMSTYYGKTGVSKRFSKTLKEEMLYVAIPINHKNEFIGTIRTSRFIQNISMLLSNVRQNIMWIGIALIFITAGWGLFFSRKLSRPVRKLIEASSKVAGGDFDVKIYLKNRGQLSVLADSFNEMTDKIKQLMTELSQQKEALDVIISSITEGLLVINDNGKILMSNESFNQIFELESPEGSSYWEVIREPELGELIEEISEKKNEIVREIEIKNRVYICSANYQKKYEEIIITLHDISEIRKTEKIKKDFVVNVSHELRTPLTAIKGFVETIKESADGKTKRYAEIVLNHTERLINIVKDLLVLSELEESYMKIEPEKVDLNEIVENSVNIYKKDAEEKKLDIKVSIPENLHKITGDYYKLEQMFMNLLENAIKYTEEGEIKIEIKKEKNKVMIKISDTGIGIPEEQIPRIFERFYVVDKSRSRSMGGTGLGLSIVKHIVLLHNGKIEIKSTPGDGTTFIIYIPYRS